jgi:hypothetical protein
MPLSGVRALALDFLTKQPDGHRLILNRLCGSPIRRIRSRCPSRDALVEHFRSALKAGNFTPEDLYLRFGGRVPILTAEGEVDFFWRQVFDLIPLQIGVSHLVSARSRSMVFSNHAWNDYAGAPGLSRMERLHPDDRPAVKAAIAQANGAPWSVSYRMRGADGKYRHFDSSAIPHYFQDGRLAGYIGWNWPAPVAPPWDLYCSSGEFQWVLEFKSTTTSNAAL